MSAVAAAAARVAARSLRAALGDPWTDPAGDGVLYDRLVVSAAGRPPVLWGRVHPWPLPDARAAALAARGWRIGADPSDPLRHARSGILARLVGFEAERWPALRALASYLRRHPEAVRGRDLDDPGLEREGAAWALRAQGLRPLAAAVRDLGDAPASWRVVGGWALDLHRGAPSRLHDDVDVELARSDLAALRRHLEGRGWCLHAVLDRGRYRRLDDAWPVPDEVHQVHARRAPLTRRARFLDLLLVPGDDGGWRYRRDPAVAPPPRVRLERGGLPYLAPEVVLLYKGEGGLGMRPKDEDDAQRAIPGLAAAERAWLRAALARFGRAHPWTALLDADG